MPLAPTPQIRLDVLDGSARRAKIALEDKMNRWAVRHTQGYVTTDGVSVTVEDRLDIQTSCDSPEGAVADLLATCARRGEVVVRFGNGLEQVEDVRNRLEFVALEVAEIWRRVTFELV